MKDELILDGSVRCDTSAGPETTLSGWDDEMESDPMWEFPVPPAVWSAGRASQAAFYEPSPRLASTDSHKPDGPPEAPWQRWHIDRTSRFRRSRFSAR